MQKMPRDVQSPVQEEPARRDAEPDTQPEDHPEASTVAYDAKKVQPEEEETGEGGVSCEISMQLLDAQTISWASQGGIAPMELKVDQLLTSTKIGDQDEGEQGAKPGDQQEAQPDAVKPGCKPAKKSDVKPGPKPDEDPNVRPAEPDAGEKSCAISMHILDAQTISWASQGGTTPMEPYDCQPVTLFEIGDQEEGQPAAMPGDQQDDQPDASQRSQVSRRSFVESSQEVSQQRSLNSSQDQSQMRSVTGPPSQMWD